MLSASSVITLPLRATASVARFATHTALGLAERSLEVAGQVAGSVRNGQGAQAPVQTPSDGVHDREPEVAHMPEATPAPPPPTAEEALARRDTPEREPTATFAEATAEPAFDDEPDAAIEPVEESTLVAEIADPGAEDGAGAQVRIAEPWDGYRELHADDVIARLQYATPEELAVVELYETADRGRTSVLHAVERRLAGLDSPG